MRLPAETQPDFFPDLIPDKRQRKASKHAASSLKSLIIWSVSSGASSSSVASSASFDGRQLTFGFNLIYVDRGLSLALNGKWPCRDFRTGKGRDLVDYLVRDFKEWKGLQRLGEMYRAGMDIMLANLLHAHHSNGQLLISRDNTHRVYRYRNPERVSERILRIISDYLVDRGYIALQVGRSNEYQGNASWCFPLFPLIAEYEKCNARVLLHEKAELAELRERPKKIRKNGRIAKVTGSQITPSERERKRLKSLAELVRAYTRTWLDHTATLDRRYVLPWARRVFIETTKLGGRFYGAFQNIPSADRGRILIDGERTLELDFKAIHFNILYAEEGLPFMGDPYQAEGYPRAVVKAVCLHLANTDNLAGLKSCITRSGNPEVQRQYSDYQEAMRAYTLARSTGLKATKPQEPSKLEGFIEGIPVGTRGEDLLNAILRTHIAIAHRLDGKKEKDIGLRLQRKDSDIMAEALQTLEGIPVLPIHDSILCKVSDAGRVQEAMKKACIKVIGQPIKIERK